MLQTQDQARAGKRVSTAKVHDEPRRTRHFAAVEGAVSSAAGAVPRSPSEKP
jgi:hypothetical protein